MLCNYKMCPKAYLCKISYRYEPFFISALKRYVVNVSFPVPFPVGWLCFKVVLALTRSLRLQRKLVLHTVLRSFVYQIRYKLICWFPHCVWIALDLLYCLTCVFVQVSNDLMVNIFKVSFKVF